MTKKENKFFRETLEEVPIKVSHKSPLIQRLFELYGDNSLEIDCWGRRNATPEEIRKIISKNEPKE
ncbi:MAG: hypothetical protein V1808_04600 [Candidatus Daviesbacteria bacterium]